MNLRPVSDVLVVQLEPPRTTTRGGLVIPDTKPHPLRIGKVLRAGPGRSWKNRSTGKFAYWQTEVKPGERVLFMAALLQTKQGRQVTQGYVLGDDEALIRETDVLLVIDPEETAEFNL